MDSKGTNSRSVTEDLWNYVWYHGSISRQLAVDQVANYGDFLVRDCISSPGICVLTCKNIDGKILHFRINNIVEEDGQTCYQFEEECFPSVAMLIKYYRDRKKPISTSSNAVLLRPIERSTNIMETHYARLKPNTVANNGHHRSRSHSSMSASSILSLA